MNKYHLAVAGGTFDHLHIGHKTFLTNALVHTQKLLLGLTSDKYILDKTNKEAIQSYATRLDALNAFLEKQHIQDRVEIDPIHNNTIPEVWQELPIAAIIVSENTLNGAETINSTRKAQGKNTLPIVVVPLISAPDGTIISSTRIRHGDIPQNVSAGPTLHITPDLRQKLGLPFGTLIPDLDVWLKDNTIDPQNTLTVGDAISDTFNRLNIPRRLSIIDLHVARKEKFASLKDHHFLGGEQVYVLDNPAGTITQVLVSTLLHIFKKNSDTNSIVLVRGEEDLAVLPLVEVAPLGFTIFYGQPGEGVVVIQITENDKKKAHNYIQEFQAKRVL